jgi:hypothetical protein
LKKKKLFGPYLLNFSVYWAQKLIPGQEDIKIKENAFSTLVLELEFFAKNVC